MALSEAQFNDLSPREKFELYSNTKVDREAFTDLSNKFTAALDACHAKINALESGLAISSSVNTALTDSMKKMQRKLNRIEQYGRRENVVVSGLPEDCTGTEEKILKIFDKMGCSVPKSQIAACHPMKKRDSRSSVSLIGNMPKRSWFPEKS